MVQIKRFEVNYIQENCYVLHDETNECVIVDAGAFFEDENEEIDAYIKAHQLVPKRLLCTHGHFDHCYGTGYFYQHYQLKAEVMEADTYLYACVQMQAEQMLRGRALPANTAPLGESLYDGQVIAFGNSAITVLATPGHTPGGACFYIERGGILISGDSLFYHSIGRTDFEGGSYETLIDAIRTKLLTLPDTVVVYPGHGASTTIAAEKAGNPYI